jgi:hypothetical protein
MFPQGYCSGNFTITNNGKTSFVIVADPENIDGSVHLYRDYEGDRQQMEDEHWGGLQRKKERREWGVSVYEHCLANNKKTLRLLPGESATFYCENLHFAEGGDIYKAEMYLGDGTWAPVGILPPIGYVIKINPNNREDDDALYYSREGTNQYLYLKTGGNFKRVDEMKLGSKPKQEKDGVTFVSPDGVQKGLTHAEAKQVVQMREKKGGRDETKTKTE